MEKSTFRNKILNWKAFLFGFLLIHLFFLVNSRFTAWPEMMFWPYLVLKGWLPYRDMAIAHNPLLIVDLSIFNLLFGVGLWQLKVYTWILILLTDFLLFWITKKLWGVKVAIFALLFYIPLSLFYEGNGLWFDLALAPLGLLIYYSLRQKKYLWSGIWWGIAFLTKQTAFWFLIPIMVSALQGDTLKGLKMRLKKIIQGVFLVFIPAFLLIWLLGILPEFIFWAYKFGVWQLPRAQGQIHLPALKELLVTMAPFFILVFLIFQKGRKNLELVIWVFAGLLGIYPRFEQFHCQPALPFLATGAGTILSKYVNKKPIAILFIAIYLFLIYVLGGKVWLKGTRFFEPEVLEISAYIKKNTRPNEGILVINTWDNLYVLSDTVPAARPWIPHLAWYMELPGIQEKIVSDLAGVMPRLIIQGEYEKTGLASYQPQKIDNFISQNYEISGKIGKYYIWRLK